MASGMGMPSMGIYAYELYKIYEVENIIRIGSCGGYSPDLKLFDIILSEQSFSESNFALNFNNENCHLVKSSQKLNKVIEETSKEISPNLETSSLIVLFLISTQLSFNKCFFLEPILYI